MTNQQKENLQKEYNKLEERHLIQKKEYQEEINELMNIIKTKEFETKAKKKEFWYKKRDELTKKYMTEQYLNDVDRMNKISIQIHDTKDKKIQY
jgi:hypothetical protein